MTCRNVLLQENHQKSNYLFNKNLHSKLTISESLQLASELKRIFQCDRKLILACFKTGDMKRKKDLILI